MGKAGCAGGGFLGWGTSRVGGCDRDSRGRGRQEAAIRLLSSRWPSSRLLPAPATDSPTDRPEWGSYGEAWGSAGGEGCAMEGWRDRPKTTELKMTSMEIIEIDLIPKDRRMPSDIKFCYMLRTLNYFT